MQYVTESVNGTPYLLARLDWPNTAEAIGPHMHDWTSNSKLFDLLYSSDGEFVTAEDAKRLAQSWGAEL